MIRPSGLHTGDRVALVATGRKVTPDDLQVARTVLASWGLTVVSAPHLYSDDHSYLAASDEHRLSDFQSMVDDPAIKLILCARGGYGTSRIIDRIDFSPMLSQPKWIVGFSDVTAIHLRLAKLGIQSLHATMPLLFGNPGAEPSVESLKKILFDGDTKIDAVRSPKNTLGEAQGVLLGGNLSLVVDSLATGNEPSFDGSILLIEETDEYFYKLDRMVTHLDRAGILSRLSGLVVGHISSPQETSLPFGENFEDIIFRTVRAYNYPVAFQVPFGHENPNLAWVHGAVAKLAVTADGTTIREVPAA